MAAVVAARAGDDRGGLRTTDGESWTWAEVVAEGAARAPLLPRHIGVLLDNVPEYVFVLAGAALAGTVVVGINPTRRGAELARDIRHTDCDLVLTDASQAHLLDGLDMAAPVQLVDSSEWRGRLAEQRGAPIPSSLPPPDALYLLIFTSRSEE